ncbi:MAG: hypothetical protein Q8P26_01860 [Candidatus Levybacteria bacterium]|nr:hypothetical protein [Candidatus Levybacteria bacterium]
MSNVELWRGTVIEKGVTPKNPLYIPNPTLSEKWKFSGSSIDDLFFFTQATGCPRLLAELAARQSEITVSFIAKKQYERIVVKMEVNRENFVILSGRIKTSPNRGRIEPFDDFEELVRHDSDEIIINSRGVSSRDLRLIPIQIGRLNHDGRFTYEDFTIQSAGIEGNSRSFAERR